MALLNFVVNLIGVALWSNWLSSRVDPLAKTSAASLAGTLRRAARGPAPRRWPYLAGLILLLLARGWFCLQISSAANWVPRLKFVLVVLSFRGDFRLHMLVFTFLSFGLVLAGFYLWLLLLSFDENNDHEDNPFVKLIRFHLKWLEPLPNPLRLLFPFVLGGGAWLALHPLLAAMAIVPATRSAGQLFAQAAIMGAGTYLAWKYLVIGILLLYTLHSYVHLGEHPLWAFVDASARNLLRPFKKMPLRIGKLDLLPPLIIAVVALIALAVDHPPEMILRRLFDRLPF